MLNGIIALSDYMAGFQGKMPGGGFAIRDVAEHHRRTLSRWNLIAADHAVLGRVRVLASRTTICSSRHVTEFFDPSDYGRAT